MDSDAKASTDRVRLQEAVSAKALLRTRAELTGPAMTISSAPAQECSSTPSSTSTRQQKLRLVARPSLSHAGAHGALLEEREGEAALLEGGESPERAPTAPLWRVTTASVDFKGSGLKRKDTSQQVAQCTQTWRVEHRTVFWRGLQHKYSLVKALLERLSS